MLQASNTGKTKFNERLVDLAGHHGYLPRTCKPYRARTKGKDERKVGYIKHNFFVRYHCFESWAHLNQMAEQLLKEEADPRLQGTVKEVVTERFEREKPFLKSLPNVPMTPLTSSTARQPGTVTSKCEAIATVFRPRSQVKGWRCGSG